MKWQTITAFCTKAGRQYSTTSWSAGGLHKSIEVHNGTLSNELAGYTRHIQPSTSSHAVAEFEDLSLSTPQGN